MRPAPLRVLTLVALAAFGIPLPSAGQSASPNAPVTINSCGPILDNNQTKYVAGMPVGTTSTGIAIEFVNTSARTADLVNFAVDANGQQFVIRDVGEFSPGVSIKHKYRNGAGQAFVLPAFIAPNVTCRVASVKFTDGTVWRPGDRAPGSAAPAPAGAMSSGGRATLTATPAQVTIDAATDGELFLVSSSERVAAFKETDDCSAVANVFVVATGQSTATYSVRPLGPGSCSVRIVDESGSTLTLPITVR